jgi:hypothetical protein
LIGLVGEKFLESLNVGENVKQSKAEKDVDSVNDMAGI